MAIRRGRFDSQKYLRSATLAEMSVAGSVHEFEYQAFLRALWKFAGAEMRLGR